MVFKILLVIWKMYVEFWSHSSSCPNSFQIIYNQLYFSLFQGFRLVVYYSSVVKLGTMFFWKKLALLSSAAKSSQYILDWGQNFYPNPLVMQRFDLIWFYMWFRHTITPKISLYVCPYRSRKHILLLVNHQILFL